MKKLIAGIGIATVLCGCGNFDTIDMNYTFDTAVIHWPDDTMKEIKIKKWCNKWHDYEGEQIQIIGNDGKTYLFSMNNAVLIRN